MTPFQISEGIYVAAIFTAKVTHWKKNAICTKALFLSLSCEGRCVGRAGVRAIRRDLLSALTLNEAWCFLSRWPAKSLTIWAACSSFCSVCSESLRLFFGEWGGGWIPRSTDRAKHAGKWYIGAVCMRFLCGEGLTPPWDPHAFIQSYGF